MHSEKYQLQYSDGSTETAEIKQAINDRFSVFIGSFPAGDLIHQTSTLDKARKHLEYYAGLNNAKVFTTLETVAKVTLVFIGFLYIVAAAKEG